MLVTSSAPGTSVQMVPNILIPVAPGFQGVLMLQGMPGFQGLQMVQRLPMVQGMPMVQGIPMLQGIPMVQGMSMMQQQLQPTVVQDTSLQPGAPAASLQAMPKRPRLRLLQKNSG